ncbi:MAG: glycosyl hydrolase [Pseudomonadota bacterium]
MSRLAKYSAYVFGGIIGLSALSVLSGYFWIKSQITDAFVPYDEAPDAVSIETYQEEPPLETRGTFVSLEPISLDFTNMETINPATRPWVRWWWPGADVDAEQACTELEAFEKQGFGGVEIQPFTQGLDQIDDPETERRIRSFDTPSYYGVLGDVLTCAAALNIEVYLNHLSGWPAGGPHVLLNDGMQTLASSELILNGGKRIIQELPGPEPTFNFYALGAVEKLLGLVDVTFSEDDAKLLSVVAMKVVSGERARNPFDLTDTIELDPTTAIVLDEFIHEGTLEWDAPDGKWAVVTTYVMPAGEAPTLVASDRLGQVIDHLSEDKVIGHYNYAFGERTGLDEHYSKAFKGFFNDSLEFKIDQIAVEDILEEFERRRGYDLRPHLPAVFYDASDNSFIFDPERFAPRYRLSELDARIRHDFQQTVSDLIIERFGIASAEWAESRGLYSRAQSYGMKFDVLRALGANHIPETEQHYAGGTKVFLKMASSAAALYDRHLVSAESFVWFNRDYAVTPRKLKAGADKLFVSGINQVIYHGIPYRAKGQAYREIFGDAPWHPWSAPDNFQFSGDYGEGRPIWDALPNLNAYIARAQALLQTGRPEIDVYIYYPWLGAPNGSLLDPHEFLRNGEFDPEIRSGNSALSLLPFSDRLFRFLEPTEKNSEDLAKEKLRDLIDSLDAHGITWGWINDHALQTRNSAAQGVVGADVKTILVAHSPTMEFATSEALEDWIADGTSVHFLGELPSRTPSFRNAEQSDVELREILEQLSIGRRSKDVSGLIDDLEPALSFDRRTEIHRTMRVTEDGDEIHFFANQSLANATVEVSSSNLYADKKPYWFDAFTGAVWPATEEGNGTIIFSASPLESRFLIITNKDISQPITSAISKMESMRPEPIENENWLLKAEGNTIELEDVTFDLRENGTLKHAAAPFVYSKTFDAPANAIEGAAILELAGVEGVATVTLNGEEAPLLSIAPLRVDVTRSLRLQSNELEIIVTPPERNELVGRALAGEETLAHLLMYEDALMPIGLTEPVILYHKAK